MNFLAVNMAELSGILGIVATVTTVFLVPFIKWAKKRHKQIINDREERKETVRLLKKLKDQVGQIDDCVKNNSSTLKNFIADYDDFTTQNLKFMINDAFFTYHSVCEIPDEVLINACECCDIYVHKKQKNHEIKPRCRMLWEELERRSVEREDLNEQ